MNAEKWLKITKVLAYQQLGVGTAAQADTIDPDSVTQLKGATDRCRYRRRMAKDAITAGQSALAGSRDAKWTAETRDRNGVEQSNNSGAICGTVPESRGDSSAECGGQGEARNSVRRTGNADDRNKESGCRPGCGQESDHLRSGQERRGKISEAQTMTPWLTDAEIDDLCAGLATSGAKVRHLRSVGLHVTTKPNGRPLVMRVHAEVILSGLNQLAEPAPQATRPQPNRDALLLAFSKPSQFATPT